MSISDAARARPLNCLTPDLGVVAVLIDPACCTRTAPCPPAGRRDDRQPKIRPCPNPYASLWRRCTQPHSRCSSTSTSTEDALNLSAPSSRSFVLAALRALHLDTGVGSALSTSRSKQLKTPLTTPRPFRDDYSSTHKRCPRFRYAFPSLQPPGRWLAPVPQRLRSSPRSCSPSDPAGSQ